MPRLPLPRLPLPRLPLPRLPIRAATPERPAYPPRRRALAGRLPLAFLAALTALTAMGTVGCASSAPEGDADDESWRTASQRVGDRRPLPGDRNAAKAAEAAAAKKKAEERALQVEIVAEMEVDENGFLRWRESYPAPEKVTHVDWEYTPEALQARIQGVVILDLYVDETGAVVDVGVVKDLPMGLTEEAVEAARKWRYQPVMADGELVKIVLRETLDFRLQ